MDKNAIQKYAIWARNELIEQVKQRAYQYGINDKGYDDENASVAAGRVLSADEKRQRAAFISEIKRNGYQQAVEEVTYTWFNRLSLCAGGGQRLSPNPCSRVLANGTNPKFSKMFCTLNWKVWTNRKFLKC